MRMFKVMIIAIMSAVMILSGCEKDEVVPIAEKTTNVEQSTEQALTEKQDKQQTTEAIEEEIDQKQQESSKNSTSPINSNDSSEEVKKDEEKDAQEPSKETTEQRSNTTASTNKPTTKTEGNETNKASTTTTQKTQTSTNKKTTTSESNEKQPETAKEQVTTPPPKKEDPKQTVTISVVGDQQKGTILSSTKVEMKEGNTVLDVTLAILKQKGIPISVRGSGSSAYVEGIDNLYEFDRGPLSGWTVKRNGAKLDRSAGAIQVKNSDSIQWIYTSN